MGSTPARCGEETLAQLVEAPVSDNAKVIGSSPMSLKENSSTVDRWSSKTKSRGSNPLSPAQALGALLQSSIVYGPVHGPQVLPSVPIV